MILTMSLCTGNDGVINLPIRMTEDLGSNEKTTSETNTLISIHQFIQTTVLLNFQFLLKDD